MRLVIWVGLLRSQWDHGYYSWVLCGATQGSQMVYIRLDEGTGMVGSDSIRPSAPYRYRTEIPRRLMLPDPSSAGQMKGAPVDCRLVKDFLERGSLLVLDECVCVTGI